MKRFKISTDKAKVKNVIHDFSAELDEFSSDLILKEVFKCMAGSGFSKEMVDNDELNIPLGGDSSPTNEYDDVKWDEEVKLSPSPSFTDMNTAKSLEIDLAINTTDTEKPKTKKRTSNGLRSGSKEEKQWASISHKTHLDKVMEHIKLLYCEITQKKWKDLMLKNLPLEVKNYRCHTDSLSKNRTKKVTNTRKKSARLQQPSNSKSQPNKRAKRLKKCNDDDDTQDIDDDLLPLENKNVISPENLIKNSDFVAKEDNGLPEYQYRNEDEKNGHENAVGSGLDFDLNPVDLVQIKKIYSWFTKNFLVVCNCNDSVAEGYYDRMEARIFEDLPARVSLELSILLFLVMADCIGLCSRSVWVLDKIVVPNRFLEKNFSPIARKILSCNCKKNYCYPVGFLSHWDAENKDYGKPSFFKVCEEELEKFEVEGESVRNNRVADEGGANIEQSLPRVEGVDGDEPFCWVEVWNGDRWITLDIARCIFDKASVMISGNPRRSTAGVILALNPWGHFVQLTAKYSRAYSEAVARIADFEWLESRLKEHNDLVDFSSNWSEQKMNQISFFRQYDDELISKIIEEEPFPSVLEAYRRHPFYCLERFVNGFHVLKPNARHVHVLKNGELVFKRSDVSEIHTVERWIERGYQVRAGEVPHVYLKKLSLKNIGLSEEESEKVGYYGDWQIEAYDPGEVINGVIPKNKFGNVYFFNSEALPRGSVRVSNHPRLKSVCKKLGFDCAQAMTGFKIQGGWFTPNLDGWIIAKENEKAIFDELNRDQIRREEEKRQKKLELVRTNWMRICYAVLIKKVLDITTKGIQFQAISHTHSFPREFIEDGGDFITRKCPCGYTDRLEKI